jgi:hypothetical protein
MDDKLFNAVMYIIAAYFIVSQIMMIYFWYLYAKNHDFLTSLIIGPIIAEIKGLLWPFFI